MLTKGQLSAVGTITKDWELPHILFAPLYLSSLKKDTGDRLTHILE